MCGRAIQSEQFRAWFITKTFSNASFARHKYNFNSEDVVAYAEQLVPLYLEESAEVLSIKTEYGKLPHTLLGVAEMFSPSVALRYHDNKDRERARYKEVRRRLGQLMTPRVVVEKLLDDIASIFPKTDIRSVLDPACGTGNFLASVTTRYRNAQIMGIDIDPINLFRAFKQTCLASDRVLLYWADSIDGGMKNRLGLLERLLRHNGCEVFASALRQNQQQVEKMKVDLLVGNPPWINFNDLSPLFREWTKPEWTKLGLVSQKGFSLLLGSGKADLSYLFTYEVIDRYLNPGGYWALVLPQSAFRAGDAASGFRRFNAEDGRLKFSVVRVYDFGRMKVFDDAQVATTIAYGKKGEESVYPIEYYICEKSSGNKMVDFKDIFYTKKFAYPIREPGGVFWLIEDEGNKKEAVYGENAYSPRQGINTGGANSIFIEKGLSIEEFLIDGKFKGQRIETALVYPILTYGDLKKWRARPTGVILLPYSPGNPKSPIPEEQLAENYPKTWNYLKRCEEVLLRRTAVGFRGRRTFYCLFGIGDYTFAEYKVVWNSLGVRKFAAAVVKPVGNKTVIPNQALQTYISCRDSDEAYYLCGLLNSDLVSSAIANLGHQGGKSFAQPSQIRKIRIPKWSVDNKLMRSISDASKEAHEGSDNASPLIERQINYLVEELYRVISS